MDGEATSLRQSEGEVSVTKTGRSARQRSRLAFYLPSLSTLAGCTTIPRGSAGAVPRVGAPMPPGSSTLGFAPKGRILRAHSVDVEGVHSDFDIRCGSPVVVSVKTADPDFRTSEGIAVGDPLEAAASVPGSQLGEWNETCGVLLPSGWLARSESEDGETSCQDRLGETISYFDAALQASQPGSR